MVKTTKEQRKALAFLYSRTHSDVYHKQSWMRGYRQFRKKVFPFVGDPTCIMVNWGGMTVGIERDGYIHS